MEAESKPITVADTIVRYLSYLISAFGTALFCGYNFWEGSKYQNKFQSEMKKIIAKHTINSLHSFRVKTAFYNLSWFNQIQKYFNHNDYDNRMSCQYNSLLIYGQPRVGKLYLLNYLADMQKNLLFVLMLILLLKVGCVLIGRTLI